MWVYVYNCKTFFFSICCLYRLVFIFISLCYTPLYCSWLTVFWRRCVLWHTSTLLLPSWCSYWSLHMLPLHSLFHFIGVCAPLCGCVRSSVNVCECAPSILRMGWISMSAPHPTPLLLCDRRSGVCVCQQQCLMLLSVSLLGICLPVCVSACGVRMKKERLCEWICARLLWAYAQVNVCRRENEMERKTHSYAACTRACLLHASIVWKHPLTHTHTYTQLQGLPCSLFFLKEPLKFHQCNAICSRAGGRSVSVCVSRERERLSRVRGGSMHPPLIHCCLPPRGSIHSPRARRCTD